MDRRMGERAVGASSPEEVVLEPSLPAAVRSPIDGAHRARSEDRFLVR